MCTSAKNFALQHANNITMRRTATSANFAKMWEKAKKSHPRRLHGHQPVTTSKQAKNLAQDRILVQKLKISHCDTPATSPCGGPHPPQVLPTFGKKLKKSHPRRLHGHQAVPPSKQAKNLAQDKFWVQKLKILQCDTPATSPRGGPDQNLPLRKMRNGRFWSTAAATARAAGVMAR